jgi:hypothetical protein
MSIFGNIMSVIFGGSKSQAPGAAPVTSGSRGTTPSSSEAPLAPSANAANTAVDVAAVVGGMAAKKKEKLDWRRSIVDLMKVLDLDSSLAARKQLAQELGYTGELNGSAEMNTWLHKQVMKKLAENGGKVPAELTS